MKIIRESKDVYELERRIHELTQKVSRQLLEWAAEEMDKKLMEDRGKRVWEVVGFRAKQKEKRKYTEEDIEEWLKVSLPILEGPFASKSWIKYVLKVISGEVGYKNFTS
ncbi:UPF0236 family protein [Caldanaerobacter subterraneus]|uniref:Uncharacterized protein n=1 Tax=Caldanaerobacter subterraneus TaxID=911092 RepID=A0A4R2KDL0_9THEO|nr:UPF0236 family protein [Caldanaerobacter subterraneus]TCO68329.1 hypothetical protein EV203_10214 [Caldanaerobacter subterraneus]